MEDAKTEEMYAKGRGSGTPGLKGISMQYEDHNRSIENMSDLVRGSPKERTKEDLPSNLNKVLLNHIDYFNAKAQSYVESMVTCSSIQNKAIYYKKAKKSIIFILKIQFQYPFVIISFCYNNHLNEKEKDKFDIDKEKDKVLEFVNLDKQIYES